MPTSYATKNGRTAKRGLFAGGVWLCDCEPRLPADKFQVKKGNNNHGRWFYTCQKAQHKRCGFFLWTDEAKIREEAAVLGNSKSEHEAPVPPKTPQKKSTVPVPLTPETRTHDSEPRVQGQAKDLDKFDPEESFDWSSCDDEELLKAEQQVLERRLFETPRKTPRTDAVTSPGKRKLVQTSTSALENEETWPLSDDVFTTPSTSHRSDGTGLLSPSNTPAKKINPTDGPGPDTASSSLSAEALEILKKSGLPLSRQVETDLVDLLNKYELRTQGIVKGRDITRLAVQAKDKRIAELQTRISTLELEKETSRRVISHLKLDMAASPKRGRARNLPPTRRSEV